MIPKCSDELKELYRRDEVAEVIFDLMAGYERNLKVIKLDIVTTKLETDRLTSSMSAVLLRKSAIDFFRKLERLGLGRFIAGRRGKQSRFEWHEDVKMIEIGKCAKGGSADVPTTVVESDSLPHRSLPEDAAHLRQRSIRHTYNVRKDFEVAFELPGDLTSHEANRLSCFVRTLPFSSTPEENGS